MLDDMANESETRISGSNLLPFILILFTASGCSALIYEIVWYQLLQLAIGSTAISLGILLATFMGGLCLGSIGASRFRAAMQSPLRVYAFLELGIALCSIAVLFGIPYIDRVYIAVTGYGLPGTLLRALICAVCLLPPTVLMGASFPVIARWVESTPRGISWLGLLYSGNTAGAVFGCLFAGFYLLRIYSVSTATYVAATINLLIAVSAFCLAARVLSPAPAQFSVEIVLPGTHRDERANGTLDRRTIFAAIALSGATALGAEVIWTRLMGMMLGATVYVFSIILAVFLIGLAIGGTGGSFLLRVVKPRLAFGWCQILLCLAIAWTAYTVAGSLPYWPINTLLSPGPWYTFQLDLVRCLWAILPATILWGASFPLALAALASAGEDSALEDSALEDAGRLVGRLYAANTLGAIVGALGVSLVLIPWIGTQQSQRLLLVLSAIGGLVVLAPYVRGYRPLQAAGSVAAFLLFAGAACGDGQTNSWRSHCLRTTERDESGHVRYYLCR